MTGHVISHVMDLDREIVIRVLKATKQVKMVYVKVGTMLPDSDGITFLVSDVDECKIDGDTRCKEGDYCLNNPGSFSCLGQSHRQ